MSSGVHGVLGEFATPEAVLVAARAAHAAGYRSFEAYTPQPVAGLPEAVGFPPTRLSALVFLGGLGGGSFAYAMQWFSATRGYPLNVGGRPLHSWPAFVPITFELTVLAAALCAVLGMLARNGLPRPYHPVFHAPQFRRASQSHFFLCLQADDPIFEMEKARAFLVAHHSLSVEVLPA